MAISRALRARIESDAKSADYWYVPHGQAISVENFERIAEHLRVLATFQTVPWDEAQPLYARELLKRNLIAPYKTTGKFSAVARMQFPVWGLLGLAWVNTDGAPEVTELGKKFVATRPNKERQDLLEIQLSRYQFHNPSLSRHFRPFRTFPVIGLYRLLSHCNWRLSWDEFLLFGTRSRSFTDADMQSDLVDEWRTLTAAEQGQLKAVAQTVQADSHTRSEEGTTWHKLGNDFGYVKSLLGILTTINQTDKGLEVRASSKRKVQRIVLEAAGTAEFVEYETQQDWLATYGSLPKRPSSPWTTASDARSYYERVGRIDAAADAFAREESGRSQSAIDQYQRIQVLERVLEDILEFNLGALEKGLKLVKRQFPTAVGPIDLLATDPRGVYVVIELKRGRGSDRVVGQTARYMTWVVQRLCRGKQSRVRAIVVGQTFDKHFEAAIQQLQRATAYTFDLRILCEPWKRSKGEKKHTRRKDRAYLKAVESTLSEWRRPEDAKAFDDL